MPIATYPDTSESLPIPITKAMRKELRRHWKRTAISTRRVLERSSPIPEGLTIAMVNDWIANRLHEARPSHWNFVVKSWATIPDCEGVRLRNQAVRAKLGRPFNVPNTKRIPLTKEMSAQFRAELVRTNADMKHNILDYHHAPQGLTQRVLYVWLYMNAKTTRADHWEFAMQRLAAMPDFESMVRTQSHAVG